MSDRFGEELSDARRKAYKEGYEQGKKDGFDDGYADGFDDARLEYREFIEGKRGELETWFEEVKEGQ